MGSVPLVIGAWMAGLYVHLCRKWLDLVVRIFQEKPLFVIPRGQPVNGAEDVRFSTPDGVLLRARYLPTTAEERAGVILFGLEISSNRWSCLPYRAPLLE